MKKRFIIIAGLLLVGVIYGQTPQYKASVKASKAATAKAKACTKEAWICAAEKHELTMRWNCEDAIKAGLKDPRSYQANDVAYWPSMNAAPALVMVKVNYTAKNSFGGAARGNAVCHASANGSIVSSKFL